MGIVASLLVLALSHLSLPLQVVTAMGKTWHPEHFVCTHCQEEIGSRNFFERDGQPYCEKDYHNLFSPRCYYCNGPILDVSACWGGGSWVRPDFGSSPNSYHLHFSPGLEGEGSETCHKPRLTQLGSGRTGSQVWALPITFSTAPAPFCLTFWIPSAETPRD